MGGETQVGDPVSESKSIVAVPLSTKTESLKTLEKKESAEGVESGAEISQEL
jgi:hypothetical protein